MAKKISNRSILGEQGRVFIEQTVLEMGYLFRPEQVFDAGVDGHIEIRDPHTEIVTNRRILLQAKANQIELDAEGKKPPTFTVDKDDLDYWFNANLPVVLIVCYMKSREAYWISIKDYFSTPEKRNKRKVTFDVQRDRFDKGAAEKLAKLVQIPVPVIQPPLSEVIGRSELTEIIINDLENGKIVQLWGMPGVGKSTLATFIGSRLKKSKGSLLLDVRTLFLPENSGSPQEQESSLERLIRHCIEPFGRNFEGHPLATAQTLFADSERLLVLDNLDDFDLAKKFINKVRPKHLIITARSDYQGDFGSYGVSRKVELISLEESIQQFRNDSQVISDFDLEIAEVCGSEILDRLPLAVNIVATQVREGIWENPQILLADLKRKKLDYVQTYTASTPSTSARLAFQLSYEQLFQELRDVFLVLGMLSPIGFSAHSVAWMLNVDVNDITRQLNELKRRALIYKSHKDRYKCHTLIWECAKERAVIENKATELEEKLIVLLEHISKCFKVGHNGEITVASDFNEVDKHWEQGVWAIKQFYPTLPVDQSIFLLIDGLSTYLALMDRYEQSLDLHYFMLSDAIQKGHVNRKGVALAKIARALLISGRLEEAMPYYEASLKNAEGLNDWTSYSRRIGIMGEHYLRKGDVDKAELTLLEALKSLGTNTSMVVEAYIIGNLGAVNYRRQKYDMALACWIFSLDFYIRIGSPRGTGAITGLVQALDELGNWKFDQRVRSLFNNDQGDKLLRMATHGRRYIFFERQSLSRAQYVLDRINEARQAIKEY
jgi:tetratricopeptide (TPR) repeat protein